MASARTRLDAAVGTAPAVGALAHAADAPPVEAALRGAQPLAAVETREAQAAVARAIDAASAVAAAAASAAELGAVGAANAALELTPDNFDAEVKNSGKSAFIKFLAPW